MEPIVPSLLDAAVNRLKVRERGWAKATEPPGKGERPPSRGKGLPAAAGASSSGPVALAEADYSMREYWPVVHVTSSDGLFVIEIEPIRSILLESGDLITYKQPE